VDTQEGDILKCHPNQDWEVITLKENGVSFTRLVRATLTKIGR
jgi:hypothetical protein